MRVLATSLVAVAVVASAAAAASKPALRVVDPEPLVVRGSGFAAGERVTVRAELRGRTLVRRVRAGNGGGFAVRFPYAFDFCAGIFKVRAAGVRSGTVTVRPTPRPCVHLAD